MVESWKYIYNLYHPHMFGLYEKECDILLINYSIFHLQWFEGSVKVLKWNKNADIPNSKVGGDLVRRKLLLEAVFFLVIHWKLNLTSWNTVTIPMCEIVFKKLWPWICSFNSSGKSQAHWSQASAVEEWVPPSLMVDSLPSFSLSEAHHILGSITHIFIFWTTATPKNIETWFSTAKNVVSEPFALGGQLQIPPLLPINRSCYLSFRWG